MGNVRRLRNPQFTRKATVVDHNYDSQLFAIILDADFLTKGIYVKITKLDVVFQIS